MKRLLAVIALMAGSLVAGAAPAQACTLGQGGDVYHHSSSYRTHMQITTDWGYWRQIYYLPRGYRDDSFIAGSDCGSENDTDGIYSVNGYALQFANAFSGWQVVKVNAGWYKINDATSVTARFIPCSMTTAC